MSFDPNSVEAFDADIIPHEPFSRIQKCVLASDYNKLLSLYRELREDCSDAQLANSDLMRRNS